MPALNATVIYEKVYASKNVASGLLTRLNKETEVQHRLVVVKGAIAVLGEGDKDGYRIEPVPGPVAEVEQPVVKPRQIIFFNETGVTLKVPFLKETATCLVGTDEGGTRRWFNKETDKPVRDGEFIRVHLETARAKQKGYIAA